MNNIVVTREYVVELREYQATFDAITGKMMTFPSCTMGSTMCDTGESIIVYSVDKTECRLTLLKNVPFHVMEEKIFSNQVNVRDQKRRVTTVKQKDTPKIYVTVSY